ncbi:MAG: SGNH/GDSL hydrolase family protein [Rhodothermales bacterium]
MRPILTIGFCLTCCAAIAQNADPPNYFDPARFEADIRAFEKADSTSAYPDSSIIFYGSSSIRMWHDSLASDMAPLPVLGRGFGGSTMIDAVKYADRVLIPNKPRAIVLYEGDNDIGAFDVAPGRVTELFEAFAAKIHAAMPETQIYFLTIKPSPSRWDHWPQMNEANQMIHAVCDADPLLHYVDVASVMLGEDGMPKKDIFREDMLHMNRKGYALWTEVIRKALGAE